MRSSSWSSQPLGFGKRIWPRLLVRLGGPQATRWRHLSLEWGGIHPAGLGWQRLSAHLAVQLEGEVRKERQEGLTPTSPPSSAF